MFANILRSQARRALTSCTARASVLSAARVSARIPSVPTVSTLRAISTSKPVWAWQNDRPERRFQDNPENNSLFVGNLPYNTTEAELRDKFEPYGEIKSIRVAYSPDGRARGFAHIEFLNLADAVGAVTSVAEEPMYLLDRDLRVHYAAPRRDAMPREPTNTLYFTRFQGTEEDLREAANEFDSSITSVRFLTDRETGRETGAGFIQFTSTERATEALAELNGRPVGEETLKLRFASVNKQSDRGGRGGGGNRGGDRDFRGGNREGHY